MRRKILLIGLSLSLMITLSACGNKESTENVENKDKEQEQVDYGELPGQIDEDMPVEYRNDLSMKLGGKIEDFQTQSLDGKEIDKTIFKDSQITVLNIWGNEKEQNDLKGLQALYNEVKDGDVNVLGVVHDKDALEDAKKAVESNGVEFTNISPDESMSSNLLDKLVGLPTTLFVNQEGQIVGDYILGPVSIENYKKALETAKNHNKEIQEAKE